MKRLVLLLALSLPVFAQLPSGDVGLWIARPALAETNEDLTDTRHDPETGFGLSFNHYWTDSISTEISTARFESGMEMDFFSIEGEPQTARGTLETTVIAAVAQWHFRRGSTISPYVGVGGARISGDYENESGTEPPLALEAAASFVLNAGLDVNLTERFALSADAKQIAWNIGAGRDIRVNPLLLSAGVRFRY